MKTKVIVPFFLSGDEITEKPQNGTHCYRCGEIIKLDDKHAKLASLIVKNDKLIIHWNWFCEECLVELGERMNIDI